MRRHNIQYDLKTNIITGTGSGGGIPNIRNVVELKWFPPFQINGYLYSAADKKAYPLASGKIDDIKPAIDLEVMLPGEYESLPKKLPLASPLKEISDLELKKALSEHTLWLNSGGTSKVGRPLKLQGYNLRGRDFSGQKLDYIKLIHCDLTEANFAGTIINHANLGHSKLESVYCSQLTQFQGCELIFADYKGVNLQRSVFCGNNCFGASFENADFSGATMLENDLRHCSFINAKICNSRIEGTNLSDADLRDCDLSNSNCSSSDFRNADFKDAILNGANFSHANLTFARHVKFDNNNIVQTKLTPTHAGIVKKGFLKSTLNWLFYNEQKDWWNTLRRQYTGANFFVYMFATLVFFIPSIFKLIIFQTVSSLEAANFSKVIGVTDSWTSIRGWQILFYGSWLQNAATASLLIFNTMRGWLTHSITRLSDEVMLTGITPALKQYQRFIYAHYIISALFWYSLCNLIFHIFGLLSAEIRYPAV